MYEIEYKGKKLKIEKDKDGKCIFPFDDLGYSGLNLKPAVEVILVVMKPLSEKSYTDQAIKNGKGITFLDDCRIPYEDENLLRQKYTTNNTGIYGFNDGEMKLGSTDDKCLDGRFPANLLVNDDVLNDGNITKSSKGKPRRSVNDSNEIWNSSGFGNVCNVEYNDQGSYSRYFSLDAWADKNLPELPENIQATYPFMIVPKASKSEKNNGLDGLEEKTDRQKGHGLDRICGKCGAKMLKPEDCKCEEPDWITPPKKCSHPTVKPIKLMSYLITLGSRPNDTILDPFMGSGTTGIAAKLLNRNFIGIELSPEYMIIAKERIKNFQENKKKK